MTGEVVEGRLLEAGLKPCEPTVEDDSCPQHGDAPRSTPSVTIIDNRFAEYIDG
jgi:hypothetical protein